MYVLYTLREHSLGHRRGGWLLRRMPQMDILSQFANLAHTTSPSTDVSQSTRTYHFRISCIIHVAVASEAETVRDGISHVWPFDREGIMWLRGHVAIK